MKTLIGPAAKWDYSGEPHLINRPSTDQVEAPGSSDEQAQTYNEL